MIRSNIDKQQRGFSLISLLIGVVLIVLLYLYLPKIMSIALDPKTKKVLKEQGIDTSSYKDMIDSAKKTTEKVEKIMEERKRILEEIK